ncbi:MAG: glycosyltransferase family 2 protein, partial [Candidatus Omnitrophota bacterium]
MVTSSISVIFPAYNEASYIRTAVIEVRNFLEKKFDHFEIIVIDDGSSDNTYEVVSQLSRDVAQLKVLRNSGNYGKGYSVKRGMLSAKYEYGVFTDVDLSTPIDELSKCIPYLEKGIDIVIGSRALRASCILKRQSLLRRSMGKIFNFCVQTVLFRGTKDTQCGFKIFRRNVAQKLFALQKLHGFCFDVEILYIAKKL